MILNVIRKDDDLNQKTEIDKYEDNVQIKQIRKFLNESNLRYVSDNVRNLLKIKKSNDLKCFVKSELVSRKVIKPGEKFRVTLYIRLSQEDVALANNDVSQSIKNQLLLLLEECSKHDWVVVGIFCEEDISGVDDNRPEWLKCIRFAEVGNTEIVLCKNQARFTRSMEMVEKYLHKLFPEWNVRFLGLLDSADTNVRENKKARQINGLANEWFVEDTSKSTIETLDSMKRNGQFTGSYAPYGYFIDPKDKHHLIPDPYARKAINLMVQMLKEGKGLSLVREALMKRGFLTPADYKRKLGMKLPGNANYIKEVRYQVEDGDTLQFIANKFYVKKKEIQDLNNLKENIKKGDVLLIPYRQPWTNEMIKKIILDKTQTGALVQGRTRRTSYKNHKPIKRPEEEWIVVPHCHEANIDLDTYDYICSLFKKNRKRREQKNGEVPLFSGKVYCECCGKVFYKDTSHVKGGKKDYLRCRGNKKINGYICDNTESIDLESFKNYILNSIKEKIQKYFDLSKVSKEYYLQSVYSNMDKEIEELQNEKNEIECNISKKNNLLTSLYEDKVNGILTSSEFIIIKDTNMKEIERLKNKLSEIETKIIGLNIEKSKQEENEKLFEKYRNIKELNKVILDSFIKRIIIGKVNLETSERPIKIEWNFQNI